ncbi:hypothetical protein J7J18_04900 [bacterium]|nr:hypothetical protein [bacterium]
MDIDEECGKVVSVLVFNTISYKLKEIGELVLSNMETYDVLVSHSPKIRENREKFDNDVKELSKKMIGKIVEVYKEYEDSVDNSLHAKMVFWETLMAVFGAIMLQEAEYLGNIVSEIAQEELGGVKVD